MKIAFFGINSLAYDILSRTNINKHLLVTIDNKKAKQLNINDYNPKIGELEFDKIYNVQRYNLINTEDEKFFKVLNADIGVVVGWNRLIPENILKTFKFGCLGFHGTPFELPKGRGRSPAVWTIVKGYDKYNYYIFKLKKGIDDGPLYGRFSIDVNDFDNINSISKKMAIIAAKLIDEKIPMILSQKIAPEYQPTTKATYFQKREFADGLINWNDNTKKIYDLIRAITLPYPCAHTFYQTDIIKIIKAFPFSNNIFKNKKCGEVCDIFIDGQFIVKTNDGSILVTEYDSPIVIKRGFELRSYNNG